MSENKNEKVVNLRAVAPTSKEDNHQAVACLEKMLRTVKERGYTQVAIVASTPYEGYTASFGMAPKDADETKLAGIYNLIGAVSMLRRFIEEVADQDDAS